MNSAKFPYTETESDTIRRKDGGVAPPINIFGLFQHPDYDSDLDSSTAQPEGGEGLLVGDDGENQELKIGGRTLVIRQHAYHQVCGPFSCIQHHASTNTISTNSTLQQIFDVHFL